MAAPGAGAERQTLQGLHACSLLSPVWVSHSLCRASKISLHHRPLVSTHSILLAGYQQKVPNLTAFRFPSSMCRIIHSTPENSKEKAQMVRDRGGPGSQCSCEQAPFGPGRCTWVLSAGQQITTVSCHHQMPAEARGLSVLITDARILFLYSLSSHLLPLLST